MPFYCPPDEFAKEIRKSKELGELTPKAIEFLMAIIENASKKLKYKNPQDREDCIMFAMEDVLRYWKGFDFEKSDNPFAYFTQMIKNGFAKGWNKLYPIKSSDIISISHENFYNMD